MALTLHNALFDFFVTTQIQKSQLLLQQTNNFPLLAFSFFKKNHFSIPRLHDGHGRFLGTVFEKVGLNYTTMTNSEFPSNHSTLQTKRIEATKAQLTHNKIKNKLLLENTYSKAFILHALIKTHLKCSITSLKPTPSKHHLIKMHVAVKKSMDIAGRNIQSSYWK